MEEKPSKRKIQIDCNQISNDSKDYMEKGHIEIFVNMSFFLFSCGGHNQKHSYVDRKMTCWGVKCIGESDSAGNCKFPKPSGATILLDPTRS